MAISSRLALWEQKIREEDRVPPPPPPPPLFSVIPGGFIKQLVRETEKEAKSKEKIPFNPKEDPPGKQDDGSVIKDTTNILETVVNPAQGPPAFPKSETGPKPCGKSPSDPSEFPKSPPPSGKTEIVGIAKDAGSGPETPKKFPPFWSKRMEIIGKENVKMRAKEECPGKAGNRAKGTNKGENKEKMSEFGRKTGGNEEETGENLDKTGEKKENTRDIGKNLGENKENTGEKKDKTGEIGEKMGESKDKMRDIGKNLGENKDKMRENKDKTGKIGKNLGENKDKTRDFREKTRENDDKTRDIEGKIGENKENLGENKDKTRDFGGKTGEIKDKTRDFGDKTGETRVFGGKMGEKKDKTRENEDKMKDIGGKIGENKDKTRDIREKSGEINDKMRENKDKTRDIGGKSGEIKDKTRVFGEKTRDNTDKTRENKDKTRDIREKTRESNDKTRDIREKTGENNDKTSDIREKTGENNDKTRDFGGKVGENKDITRENNDKTRENKDKTRDFGGKIGENNDKTRENNDKTRDFGDKTGGKREGNRRETEGKTVEICGKLVEEEEQKIEKAKLKTERTNKTPNGGLENDDSSSEKDVWYETEKVWVVRKEGFVLATELKPDLGTPNLPPGTVRVRIESDGSEFEVEEEKVQKTNPARFDYAEDLASLVSLNESSVIHTLRNRFQSQLVYTYAGPDLIAIAPYSSAANGSKKAFKGKRDGMPPHIYSVAQRAYWAMLTQRQDQTIMPLGRASAGKTTCCQNALEYLVEMAGSVDNRVTVEKIQAMFTVLRAFGTVTAGRNRASTRFSMVMALDFNAAGRITAAHLQTMLLERNHVAQQPDGESNFNVFGQMLAGLDLDQRTILHLHQTAENNSFGIKPCLKAEEKAEAASSFGVLRLALGALGVSAREQGALWRVLAAIFHLGAAGVSRVGRKQFLNPERAAEAAEALGCEFEGLASSVFKHHLRRILAEASSVPEKLRTSRREENDEENAGNDGPKMTGAECLAGMGAGLYEELFAAVVSLINRSFASGDLSLASILVADVPGFRNPRHAAEGRAATFEEFCRNYADERLQDLFHRRTFAAAAQRFRDENIEVSFDLPEFSPAATVALADQNPSQVSLPSVGPDGDRKGLLWILDEEAAVQGSKDGDALRRFCSSFAKEGPGSVRKCEQDLHFELFHRLGRDPVRYDADGWVAKAKWNLSAENAARVLQESKIEALKEVFGARSKAAPVCRSVAGLEPTSQQALQRLRSVRGTFASGFAASRKRSACGQIKVQVDALVNLVNRTQIHFVHCLVPETDQSEETSLHQPGPGTWDVQSLRVQLSGGQILDALRWHRIGYADRMPLTQFRRRFQILAQPEMKKYTSAYEATDEKKALDELFQALDLEKKSVAVGRSQVFLKSGVLSRLEKQREKMAAANITLLQAACKGFLSRQNYRKLKVQRLAVHCIQKNLVVFQRVKAWPWWTLFGRIRPLLTASLAEGQLRAKEEELSLLRKKLENSEISRQEMRQNLEILETKTVDLLADLSDERLRGEALGRLLEAERSGRLRGLREVQELRGKHEELQKKLSAAEKQLEESQEELWVREIGKEEGLLDFAQTEAAFLRKRVAQIEERLQEEIRAKEEAQEKLREAEGALGVLRRASQQLKGKCQRLSSDLEDARINAENQQTKSHELQKKQKKFDLQLAQALGESAFEKSLREKISQENTVLQFNLGKMQQNLEEKESEMSHLRERIEVLGSRIRELGSSDPNSSSVLRKRLWDLEDSCCQRQKELSLQSESLERMEQLHLRLELEMENLKQRHQKEMEDKEDELEDVRQSAQKRLRQLEMQSEQETEDKRRTLDEKRELEDIIATLCEQIGHRDFEAEKRLRRDLKRSQALLADVQLLLDSASDSGPGRTAAKEEMDKLRTQWEEMSAKYSESQKSQKSLFSELEVLQTQMEDVLRDKKLLDEQLFQIQREKADLQKRIDEDQEDLNELMEKHKALIAQSAKDIAQIRDLQTQLEEAKKEKHELQEKLQASQTRLIYLEQAMVERSIVSRQESLICDLENKMEFQSVQIKRFEMLVLRLRDSVLKMGEELERAKEGETREKENADYYRMRMEEMKAEAKEMADREMEANRRRVELEKQVDELTAVRQTLQADLETSIRRIADLQAALEEVQSSDESDAESVQTARESLTSRHETESQLSLPSSWAAPASERSSPPDSASAGGTPGTTPDDPRTGPRLRINPRNRSPSSSSALSEYIEELRRKRLKGPEAEDFSAGSSSLSSLPIYQTAGASSLRRRTPWRFPEDEAEDGLPAALSSERKFGSYDSLVRDLARFGASSEEISEDGGRRLAATLVFESKRFSGGGKAGAASSASRLSKGPREKGHRPMTVRFEDQLSPGSSSSSGSEASVRSAAGPKVRRPEGCGRRVDGEKDDRRSEAEGKEDDVNSIMMKYLGKEEGK